MLARISVVAAALSLCAFLAPPTGTRAPAAPKPPNFIFIQAEATGWSSTSVDMDGEPPSHARPVGLTPNLEKLAQDGMRFSDF